MITDTLQAGRHELKYIVPETATDAMRRYVATHLDPDEHMPADRSTGYQVHTLYLDAQPLVLYRQSLDGLKNRYKLWIRFYDTSPDGIAFLEVKQRQTDIIRKLRAAVPKSAAECLLEGKPLRASDLISNGTESIRALTEFCQRRDRLNACGKVFVSYRREAYVARSASNTRVTFDRQICGQDYQPSRGLNLPQKGIGVVPNQAVLELKFSGRFPGWMRDLTQIFGLRRISFPKYVKCVDAMNLSPSSASRAFRKER